MTIAESKAEAKAIARYEEFVGALFDRIQKIYHAAEMVSGQMDTLQAMVTEWSNADPGTVEAKLYQLHLGIMPTSLNSYLAAIRTQANNYRDAVENADAAAGGEWFGIVTE